MDRSAPTHALTGPNLSRRKAIGGIASAVAAASLPLAWLDFSGQTGGLGEPLQTRDQVAAMLKPLFSCKDPAVWQLVIDAYTKCVLGKIRPSDPPLSHRWVVPGGGYYAQWLWDTMFVLDLLAIMPGQQETIRGVFQNYWDFQKRWNSAKPEFTHGMVANFMAPFDAPGFRDGKEWRTRPAYSQAPLLAWGMERVFLRNRDKELLRAGIAPVESFHEWYWRERDVTNLGLVGVGAYSGITQEARYETYDREVDLDGLKMIAHPGRPTGKENGEWYGDIAIPANTTYLLLSEQSLSRMATTLGDHAMAGRRRARYDRGVAAMRKHMWDQQSGCFLAVRTSNMEKIPNPTVGSFVPLMAKVPNKTQAARMAAVLATPEWATSLPIPTVAQTDQQFKSDEFWRGDVWPVPNYQVSAGLAAYGLRAAAARIADATVANALKVGISERYDSLSGAPLGVKGLGMSATTITMMLDRLTSRYELRSVSQVKDASL
jgi:glycogen debranching enzyme